MLMNCTRKSVTEWTGQPVYRFGVLPRGHRTAVDSGSNQRIINCPVLQCEMSHKGLSSRCPSVFFNVSSTVIIPSLIGSVCHHFTVFSAGASHVTVRHYDSVVCVDHEDRSIISSILCNGVACHIQYPPLERSSQMLHEFSTISNPGTFFKCKCHSAKKEESILRYTCHRLCGECKASCISGMKF